MTDYAADQRRLNFLWAMSPADMRRALAYLSGWKPAEFDAATNYAEVNA